jgi:hypothetical protein
MREHNPRLDRDGANAACLDDSIEVKKMLDLLCREVWEACGIAFTHEEVKRDYGSDSPIFTSEPLPGISTMARERLTKYWLLFSA